MTAEKRHRLLTRRRLAAHIRLSAYRLWKKFKSFFERSSVWKHILERKEIIGLHQFIWIWAAIWLFLEAIFLVDTNFKFLKLDAWLQDLREHHRVFDFLMKHIHPLASVVFVVWVRERAKEYLQLSPDKIRATHLIKAWFIFLAVFLPICAVVHRHYNCMTESAMETSMFLLLMLALKWGQRTVDPNYGAKDKKELSPRQKRTYSVINAVLKMIVGKVHSK